MFTLGAYHGYFPSPHRASFLDRALILVLLGTLLFFLFLSFFFFTLVLSPPAERAQAEAVSGKRVFFGNTPGLGQTHRTWGRGFVRHRLQIGSTSTPIGSTSTPDWFDIDSTLIRYRLQIDSSSNPDWFDIDSRLVRHRLQTGSTSTPL